MAKSPSHKLGQIAGYAMEEAFYEMLVPPAKEFGLYADRQEERKPARKGKFVQWADLNGNKHNLDFVLERGGSKSKIGVPAAFIESAWRRYTKHSVNKAGEISNALVPLRRTYVIHRPFLGAVVAGDWTSGGISQMESQGINVLHLPMSTIVDAFATEGVDFYFDEGTAQEQMASQVEKWESLSTDQQHNVIEALRDKASGQFELFSNRIREHLSRKVQSVLITSLHGRTRTANSVAEALALLSSLEIEEPNINDLELMRIEVQVRYSNTDRIDASFKNLSDAITWLQQNYLE